jgi:hypothetical protein
MLRAQMYSGRGLLALSMRSILSSEVTWGNATCVQNEITFSVVKTPKAIVY